MGEKCICGSSSAIWVKIRTENFHCGCRRNCLGISYCRYSGPNPLPRLFSFLGPPASVIAARALSVALRILDHLGFPVAIKGPTCCITFLGIIIDSEAFELRLPADKLHRLQALLSSWCARKSCTKKELESLLGHLSHAATVVRPERTFLHQLFSLLHLTKAPHHFVSGGRSKGGLSVVKCFL